MKKRREATPKFLISMAIIYGFFIIYQSVTVISTPHTFIRVVNLVVIIFLSVAMGAFIRETFILKQKNN